MVQGLLALLVLTLALYIQEAHLPFAKVSLNELEKRSLLATTVTLLSGLFFLDESLPNWLQVTFFAVTLLANIFFLQCWLRKAARSWLVLLSTHVPFLHRCLRIVSEANITFRRARINSSEGQLLTGSHISALLLQAYLAKLHLTSRRLTSRLAVLGQ